MGIRALVDLIAVRAVGDVGAFPQKLDELGRKGLITSLERQRLAVVIEAGSAAAHRGLIPTRQNVHHMLDCVEHLLWGQFASRRPTQALEKAIPRRGK